MPFTKSSAAAADNYFDKLETSICQLKLVNVPTMFDIGCSHSNPESETLSLSMIDNITYKQIQKKVLSKNSKREYSMIKPLRKELINFYTNMEVTKAMIEFDSKNPLAIGIEQLDGSLTTIHIDGKPV